jgi:hypothetical protein
VMSQLVVKLAECRAAPGTQPALQQPENLEVVMTVVNHAPGSSRRVHVADVCVQTCGAVSSSRNAVIWCDKVQGEVSSTAQHAV